MRVKRARSVAFLSCLLTVVACGGGGSALDDVAFRWFMGVATYEEVIDAVMGGSQIRLNFGGVDHVAEIPSGSTVAVGSPIAFIPSGTTVMRNAWLPVGSAPQLRIVDVNSGLGGVTAVGLQQDGDNIELSGDLAIPVGRWRMGFEGGYRFLSPTPTNSLSVGKVEFEFNVFSNGFSNIPIELQGNLPANGATQSGLTVAGRIPPNAGQGPAEFKLQGTGLNLSYTTNKAFGAETWSWNTNDTITIPEDGLILIGVKLDF